jgi:hypothetical protein
MLPAIATLAMGALSRQAASPAAAAAGVSGLAGGSSAGGGILGMLTPLLDRNQDGSIVDDILGSASKLFEK